MGKSKKSGESKKPYFQAHFDPRVKMEFTGRSITSDGGLLCFRELDHALGLTEQAGERIEDPRTGRNGRHDVMAMLRQAAYGRIGGHEDVNDADHLRDDPAMRRVIGGHAAEARGASTGHMGRFETEIPGRVENLAALTDLSGMWIDRVNAVRPPKTSVIDVDGSSSPVHGNQEGAKYNGYARCVCYYPLFALNQRGDVERCLLRPGNASAAADWRAVLEPVVRRYRKLDIPLYLRGDAGFATPDLYEFLEAEGIKYVIGIRANKVLWRLVAPQLERPVGRPPKDPQYRYFSFRYRAEKWKVDRRVVARIKWIDGELFPRVHFFVTNMKRRGSRVAKFHDKRGTAEQYIKEGKNAVKWTRLSCGRFDHNAVRPQLHVLAYNLANFMRTLALPKKIKHWTLTTLREKLVKIGAKVVRHGRHVTFQTVSYTHLTLPTKRIV